MKIQEVRNIVAGYSDETLRQLISDLYKCFPKKIIEAKQIDSLIRNPVDHRLGKNRLTNQKEMPNQNEVFRETEEFIRNAREQNYFAPNQIIHKRERPKWRFVVKRLYKSLIVLSQAPENIQESSRLLTDLYKLMCEACQVYLFNTKDPFVSVGIDQEDFYNTVVEVAARTGTPEQWISMALLLTLEPTVTLDHSLMAVLIERLKTAPMKEIAIGLCEQLRKQKTMPTRYRQDPKYYLEERNNALTELIFSLYMSLGEKEAAIADYKGHYKTSNAEIGLYILLWELFSNEEKALWVREYEVGLQQKVQPRTALVEAYKCIKETGDFPEYY